jgi:hypothetical protein
MVVVDAPSGRWITAVTAVNTDEAEQLLKEYRSLSLRELSVSLNVSLERIHHIVTVETGMSYACARWVPCDICDEQKRKHVEVWKWNIPPDEQNPDLLLSIITCNGVLVKTLWPRIKTTVNCLETKIFLHQENFAQHHHHEKWCYYCFLTIKPLFFSTGYLRSKLWMVFTMQTYWELI